MDLKLDGFLLNKSIVFTVTSDGYKYYTWNLWMMCARLKVPWKLCILCLDRESYEFFQRTAFVPARLFLMDGPRLEHKTPALFSTPFFKRLNRMKLKALEALSQRTDIEYLIYLDSDIAIFRDFLPDLQQRLTESPLWFQCDEKEVGRFDCSDMNHCANPCSGVIAMHLTEQTRSTFQTIFAYDSATWSASVGDQDYIQSRMNKNNVSFRTLPRNEYPNGIFLAEDRYKQGDPALIHFNYYVGSDKKRVMKSKDCWLLHV
jgi:hypothetical protein